MPPLQASSIGLEFKVFYVQHKIVVSSDKELPIFP